MTGRRRVVRFLPRAGRRAGRRPRFLGVDERVVVETRQHPFAIVGALVDALLLLIPAMLIVWGFGGIEGATPRLREWVARLLVLFMAAVIMRLVWRVLQWEFELVLLTNQKVIHVHGVLSRRIASTPLAKASEFTVSQSLLGRVFDYGSLVVDVPGGREQALHGLAYLPDPAGLYRLITDRARGESIAVHRGRGPAERHATGTGNPPEMRGAASEEEDGGSTTVLPSSP